MKVTDQSIESMVATLLTAGVTFSGVVVAFGGALYLMRYGSAVVDYHIFRPLPAEDRLLPSIIAGAFHNHARAIIQSGILLLIATPILRVAFSLVGFAIERDRKFVVITAIVLAVLLYSLISGAIER